MTSRQQQIIDPGQGHPFVFYFATKSAYFLLSVFHKCICHFVFASVCKMYMQTICVCILDLPFKTMYYPLQVIFHNRYVLLPQSCSLFFTIEG